VEGRAGLVLKATPAQVESASSSLAPRTVSHRSVEMVVALTSLMPVEPALQARHAM